MFYTIKKLQIGQTVTEEEKNLKIYLLISTFINSWCKGIAVGLSTKILPHNFNELIDASIKVLKGVKPKIYPDFYSGGSVDFSNYNDGKEEEN